jgi:hypothetical protein
LICCLYLPVFSEFNIEHITLEIKFTEWSVLNVVPQNQSVARIASVVASAHKSNNVGPEEHLSNLDTTFKVYTTDE